VQPCEKDPVLEVNITDVLHPAAYRMPVRFLLPRGQIAVVLCTYCMVGTTVRRASTLQHDAAPVADDDVRGLHTGVSGNLSAMVLSDDLRLT
jgi:hypothetical protein